MSTNAKHVEPVSRLFHRAIPYTKVGERKVTWLELFYDLVYVAAVLQFGNAIAAHSHGLAFVCVMALFVPVWLAWTGFTFFENRFIIDDTFHRVTVFLQILGITLLASGIDGVFAGQAGRFVAGYVLVRVLFAAMYLRTRSQLPDYRDLCGLMGALSLLDAALWAVSLLVAPPFQYVFWALGVACEIAIPLLPHTRSIVSKHALDTEHMVERFGLFTIIVIGESFVKILTALVEQQASEFYLTAVPSVVLVCCLWWNYFDDIGVSHIKKGDNAVLMWIYSHLPLSMAVVVFAVGLKKLVVADPSQAFSPAYAWMMGGSLATVYFVSSGLSAVTTRIEAVMQDGLRIWVRVGAGIALLFVAGVSGVMTAFQFGAVVTIIAVAQVVADLAIAPYVLRHGEERTIEVPTGPRSRLPEITVFGAPPHVRQPLFTAIVSMRWRTLIFLLTCAFIAVNLFFGALFYLIPDSIAGSDGRFWDSVFLSAQTLTSVGYGVLSPRGDLSSGLAAFEGAIGLIAFAIVTGIAFARASRPTPGLFFAKHAVVTTYDGKPTLMLRVANARNSEVADVTAAISTLIEHKTPEGHVQRRLVKLALIRSESPFLAAPWMLMHVINAESPLRGMVDGSGHSPVIMIIATVNAYDTVVGQHVYVRERIMPGDIKQGMRYKDVVSSKGNGDIMVDLRDMDELESDRV